MGIDIHSVVQPVVPGQIHQPGGHAVVVGPAAVLGADGHLVLGAGQVQAHAAHVHDEQLIQVAGDGGAAVTHLLVDGEDEAGVVHGLQSLVAEHLHQGEQAGGGALVVDKAGLEEAAAGHHGLGVNADIVPGPDAQSLHVLPGLDHLVNTHGQTVLVAGAGGGVVIDVGGGGEGEDGAGIAAAVPGTDGAVLAVQGGEDGTAHPGNLQLAVGGDGPDHQAQGVHMGAEGHLFSTFPAGNVDNHVALVGHLGLIAQPGGKAGQEGGRGLGEAAGAVNAQQLLCVFHQLTLICGNIH